MAGPEQLGLSSHVFSHVIRAQLSHKTESTFGCVEVAPPSLFLSHVSSPVLNLCLSLGCVEVTSSVTLHTFLCHLQQVKAPSSVTATHSAHPLM